MEKKTKEQQMVLFKNRESHAYQMGKDCALNGANTTNCHFSIFSCKENTKEWDRGNKDWGHEEEN